MESMFGYLRLGKIASVVTEPVICGFLNAFALFLIKSQVCCSVMVYRICIFKTIIFSLYVCMYVCMDTLKVEGVQSSRWCLAFFRHANAYRCCHCVMYCNNSFTADQIQEVQG